MSSKTTNVRPGWYVVQVMPGNEDHMCEAIAKACEIADSQEDDSRKRVGLKRCFSPKFESRKKRLGKWYSVSRSLLPGYVIADVRNPAMLAQRLRVIHEFCKVLASDETYSPLNDVERRWMEAQMSEDERTIPISFGYREGEKIIVNSGPLKGEEAMITKFDRKNCMAHVEFHVDQVTIKTVVGLVLMPKGLAS